MAVASSAVRRVRVIASSVAVLRNVVSESPDDNVGANISSDTVNKMFSLLAPAPWYTAKFG